MVEYPLSRLNRPKKSCCELLEEPLLRLYRARRTCCEMLEDRGYIVNKQENNESYQEFLFRFEQAEGQRSRMLLVGSHSKDPNKKIIVFFSDERKKIGVKPIRDLTDKMEERGIQKAILIVQYPLTSYARDMLPPKHMIEGFLESEVVTNVSKHELVPKHVLLSEEEKQNLLVRYRVKECQLPRLPQGDPIAKYLGLTKGQVAKIIRTSETAGRYITYRLVI